MPILRNSDSRVLSALAAVALSASLSACAGNRLLTIPPVEPVGLAGQQPVPAAVGVRYGAGTAGRRAVQETDGQEGKTTYTLPIGDALVEGYDAFLPRLFEKVERAQPGAAGLDGTLEIALDDVQLSLPSPSETRACRVGVAESFTLRDRDGTVVATWTARGAAQVPRGPTVDCGGTAAAGALQNAQVAMARGLEGQREVRAWLAAMGRTWQEPAAGNEARRTLARASEEVDAPVTPRVFGVRGAVGYFIPEGTDGAPQPTGGLALALAAAWRPLKWIGAELEAGNLSSTFGGVDLNQTTLALLARAAVPIGIVEPFVAAGPLVDFLSASRFSTAGAYTTRQSVQKFVAGALVMGGVDVVVAGNVEVGARWQWMAAQAELSQYQAQLGVTTVKTGGQSILVTGGYYWP